MSSLDYFKVEKNVKLLQVLDWSEVNLKIVQSDELIKDKTHGKKETNLGEKDVEPDQEHTIYEQKYAEKNGKFADYGACENDKFAFNNSKGIETTAEILPDERCSKEEGEKYSKYIKDEMCVDYDSEKNYQLEETITDENETKTDYDSHEDEDYSRFDEDENYLYEDTEDRLIDYNRYLEEKTCFDYDAYENDVYDEDENDADDERITEENRYLDEEEINLDYNVCGEEIQDINDENESGTDDNGIVDEERYLDEYEESYEDNVGEDVISDSYDEGESGTDEERYLNENDTHSDVDACENEIPDYNDADICGTDEERYLDENETHSDFDACEEIPDYYDEDKSDTEKDRITDEERYLDEEETYSDSDACEGEMPDYYDEDESAAEEDMINDEERYLDEDIINSDFDACEDENPDYYNEDESGTDQDKILVEERYSDEEETYSESDVCESEMTDYYEEDDTDEDKISDKEIYSDEEETYSYSDESEGEMSDYYDEDKSEAEEDIIQDEERYLDGDDANSNFDACEEEIPDYYDEDESGTDEEGYLDENETNDANDATDEEFSDHYDEDESGADENENTDEERYLDEHDTNDGTESSDDEILDNYCEVDIDTKEDIVTDEERYLNDDYTHTDSDASEDELLVAIDRGENDTVEERTTDDDYQTDEDNETYEEYDTDEYEMYGYSDSKDIYSKDDWTTDRQETCSDQAEGEDELYSVCDSEAGESKEKNLFKQNNNLHLKLFDVFQRLTKNLLLDLNLQESSIKKAIDHLNYNFRNVVKGKIPTELDFNDMNNCVGYLHRFAPCHALMVLNVTLNVLKSLPVEMCRILKSNNQLNVVSIGSGPGNDLIGFLSAFHDQQLKYNHLDITIIDKMSGWHKVFNNASKILKNEDCIVGRIFREVPYISTSFFEADLEQSTLWCNGMISKLENAHIVLLVKVMSNIPEASKLRTLEDIVVRMRSDALLIFIDCPIPSKEFSAMSSLKLIYKTKIQQFRLSHKVKSFGHYNVTQCRAATLIFVKQK